MPKVNAEYCRKVLDGAGALTERHIDILARMYDLVRSSRSNVWFGCRNLGCELRELSPLLRMGLLFSQKDKGSGEFCFVFSPFCFEAVWDARELGGEQHREILLELQRKAEYRLRDAKLPTCGSLLRGPTPAAKYLTAYDLIAEPPVLGEDRIERQEEPVIPYTYNQGRSENPFRY